MLMFYHNISSVGAEKLGVKMGDLSYCLEINEYESGSISFGCLRDHRD